MFANLKKIMLNIMSQTNNPILRSLPALALGGLLTLQTACMNDNPLEFGGGKSKRFQQKKHQEEGGIRADTGCSTGSTNSALSQKSARKKLGKHALPYLLKITKPAELGEGDIEAILTAPLVDDKAQLASFKKIAKKAPKGTTVKRLARLLAKKDPFDEAAVAFILQSDLTPEARVKAFEFVGSDLPQPRKAASLATLFTCTLQSSLLDEEKIAVIKATNKSMPQSSLLYDKATEKLEESGKALVNIAAYIQQYGQHTEGSIPSLDQFAEALLATLDTENGGTSNPNFWEDIFLTLDILYDEYFD